MPKNSLSNSIEDTSFVWAIDAQVARLAYQANEFVSWRAWAVAQCAHDGSGVLKRDALYEAWSTSGAANGRRQADRLLARGDNLYWTFDRDRDRVFIVGQKKLALRLAAGVAVAGVDRPGQRRVEVVIAGAIGDVAARVYAAWVTVRSQRDDLTISRDRLCELWGVSTPTLISWEQSQNIDIERNYAQFHSPEVDQVPAHAYLCAHRSGRVFTNWQLPNSYRAYKKLKKRIGKQRKIRQAVSSIERGSIADAAHNRCYFTPGLRLMALQRIEQWLRKAFQARRGNTISVTSLSLFDRRYHAIGKRYGVRIWNAYDVRNQRRSTTLQDRDFNAENKPSFVHEREIYAALLNNAK